MMWRAGRGGGGPWVHCSCGKDHASDPEVDDEAVRLYEYIELDGMLFVNGCPGCNSRLAKYEHFIWNNRQVIRDYLRVRIEQEKRWADQEHMLNIVAGITNETN
jgi:hypothetical protein